MAVGRVIRGRDPGRGGAVCNGRYHGLGRGLVLRAGATGAGMEPRREKGNHQRAGNVGGAAGPRRDRPALPGSAATRMVRQHDRSGSYQHGVMQAGSRATLGPSNSHTMRGINVVPDELSRGVLGARVNNWSLIEQVQGKANDLAGGEFDWDAFADPAGTNSQGRRFRSAVEGDYPFEPKGQSVWAFPPVELVDDFLDEVDTWGARLVVAMIPATRLRAGWKVEKTYSSSALVFVRPVGAGRAYCKGS
eukprot:192798-Rhodomonas_salina.1